MIKPTDDYLNQLELNAITPRSKIVVDGVEYLSNIIKESPKTKHSSTKYVGTFPTKSVNFTIYDFDNSLDFKDKEIEVYKGIIVNGKIEYLKQGVFIPRADNITTNISERTVSFDNVQDKTQLLEDKYTSSLDWSNDKKHSGLEIIQEICTRKKITLKNTNFAFSEYMFKQPNFNETITDRGVISAMAEIGGEIAIFDCQGELEIKKKNKIDYLLKRNKYVKLSYEKTIVINSLVLGKEGMDDDIVYPESIETERVDIKILDNPFVDLYRQEMIEEVAKHIIGLTFIPYELTDVVDGYMFELNDSIDVIDKNGNQFEAIILDIQNSSRIKSAVKAPKFENSKTNYSLAGSNKQELSEVKLTVDHINKNVESLAKDVSEDSERLTKVEQNAKSITQQVESTEKEVKDIADSIEVFSVDLSNYNLVISTDINNKPFQDDTYEIPFYAYYKGKQITPKVTIDEKQNGVTVENDATKITFKVTNDTIIANKNYIYNISFEYSDDAGKTYTTIKKVSMSLATQGNDGANGKDGKDAVTPKTIDEITGVTLNNVEASNYSPLELIIEGAYRQAVRSGRNLFNYKDTSSESGYLTPGFVTDEDGWITVSYDNTDGSASKFFNYFTNNLDVKADTDYNVIVEIKEVSGNASCRFVSNQGTNIGQFIADQRYYFSDLHNGQIIQKIYKTRPSLETSHQAGLRSFVTFEEGKSGSITFRISVLEDTTITAETFEYEPYGKMPSPDYPSNIEVVEGKNLFIPIPNSIKNGVTLTRNDDGTYNIKGTSTNSTEFIVFQNIKTTSFKDGETYTLSLNQTLPDGVYVRVEYYSNTAWLQSVITSVSNTTSIPKEATRVRYAIITRGSITIDIKNLEIQLEKGDSVTEYVPYQCIGIKQIGKNLLDLTNSTVLVSSNNLKTINNPNSITVTSNNTLVTNYCMYKLNININDYKGKTLYFKYNASRENSAVLMRAVDDDNKVIHRNEDNKLEIPNDTIATKIAISFYCALGESSQNIPVTFDDIIVSTSETDYEPYRGKTTFINLQGNKLCAINDVKDELDVVRGKITKRIGEYVFTGNENWSGSSSYHTNALADVVHVDNINVIQGLCNYFNVYAFKYMQIGDLYFHPNKNLHIYDAGNQIYPTIDDWTNFLKQKYEEGNPVKLDYVLETPEIIDLGEQPVIELFEGVNNISLLANLETNLYMEYYTNFKGSPGQQGVPGIQGPKGEDGKSTYFYVRYSENSTGNPMAVSPTSETEYMGVATTTSPTAPTSYSAYTWSKIKGDTGTQGIQGPPGSNGKSSYLHIKYSEDGKTFTPASEGVAIGETPAKWQGTYVDDNPTDSDNFDDYKWNDTSIYVQEDLKHLQEGIDQANADITNVGTDLKNNYLTSEEVNAMQKHNEESINQIKEQFSKLELLENQVEIQVGSLISDGVNKIKTATGYTFDENGLDISKSGSEIHNTIDNLGMFVKRNDEELLGVDTTGVRTENLSVRKYLVMGKNSRFEDYKSNRTGCFYVGG